MSETVHTKKSLGQHWLYDRDVLDAMCDAVDAKTDDIVLEIGPGLGTLTTRLLARGAKVKALEFDHDLAESLVSNVSKSLREQGERGVVENLNVVEGDIRTFDFRGMPMGYKVCANIPYYLTSNLIRLLCDTDNQPSMVGLLMQKEVAERIAAEDGKMSTLSCVAQFYYECYLGEMVPAHLFTPPPKVDSQILIMHRRQHQLYDVDTKKFFRLIKAGFGEKRKTLRNSLSSGLSLSKESIEQILGNTDIDPMRRAETLSLLEWKSIFDHLDSLSK